MLQWHAAGGAEALQHVRHRFVPPGSSSQAAARRLHLIIPPTSALVPSSARCETKQTLDVHPIGEPATAHTERKTDTSFLVAKLPATPPSSKAANMFRAAAPGPYDESVGMLDQTSATKHRFAQMASPCSLPGADCNPAACHVQPRRRTRTSPRRIGPPSWTFATAYWATQPTARNSPSKHSSNVSPTAMQTCSFTPWK